MVQTLETQVFETLIPPFEDFFREQGSDSEVPDYIQGKVAFLKEFIIDETLDLTWWSWLLSELDRMSQISEVSSHPSIPQPEHQSYPDQGLVRTGYEGDHVTYPPLFNKETGLALEFSPQEIQVLQYPAEYIEQILVAWLYYLELFNHPARLAELFRQSEIPFQPPQKKENVIFTSAAAQRKSITIRDLALATQGEAHERASRTDRFISGPFINYGRGEHGRMQSRSPFVGAANPDVFGTAMALSTMSQAHSLANLPRDGFFSSIQRQVDLAKKVFEWNKNSPILIGKSVAEQEKLREFYDHNLVGVVEASKEKALKRVKSLYKAGVRTFRIYSPEPGNGPLETLKVIRQFQAGSNWDPIEIFAGQVISLRQAKELEDAGADGIYIGIGGGGRCITGVVGNLTIDWPQLLWEMRGELNVPVFVEGGASDAIGVSLVLGASGIGAAGKLAGNIENPGGYLVFIDEDNRPFVYYGGEAADRMRAMAERIGPFGRVEFREGETRRIYIVNHPGEVPTLMQMLLSLHQGAIGTEVFQNTRNIPELQEKGPDTLRLESFNGEYMKKTQG